MPSHTCSLLLGTPGIKNRPGYQMEKTVSYMQGSTLFAVYVGDKSTKTCTVQ